MRHPRRNEVYRDVGSEPHAPDDGEFVDIEDAAFEPDAALLLCSDGLTDLVPSATVTRIVHAGAGDPAAVVRRLIAAANDAGGKDNVTAVYVEGPEFARSIRPASRKRRAAFTTVVAATTAVISAVATFSLLQPGVLPLVVVPQALPIDTAGTVAFVQPSESIAEALARSRPGSQVVVEPGEYHEQLRLRSGVRVVSRIPRGATIRLPITATEVDPAVVASGVTDAEFSGFRIVGDAASPLGVGVFATDAKVSIHDVEITGASRMAIDLSSGARATVVGSDIHDNAGSGLSIRAGAAPRVAHSAFARNGTSPTISAMTIEPGAEPVFYRNVFQGMAPDVLGATRSGDLTQDNWFISTPLPVPTPPLVPGARRRP
jgi:PPM family protein phosphatase